MGAQAVLAWLDAAVREATLFAAVGFLIGGIDDLLVDLLWIVRRLLGRDAPRALSDLPAPIAGRLAMFVPAWDESRVIGAMLRHALARIEHDDYRIYVGAYPNDRATIDAVSDVAARDSRVRLVIGPRPGPTTKADCLNVLWRALQADDAARDTPTAAVVLHDAEDVVHPAELRVHAALIGTHPVVQIPVVPLIDHDRRFISGHYADEFAEAHGRQLVVRAGLGAAVPLSGVGCAIATDLLRAVAARHGTPFDPASLTEDYELGLRAAALGSPAHFARVHDAEGLVSVRAYFPNRFGAAVRQKARWMTGIALSGWDRTGWARPGQIADHWMRMRDRRAPLALLVLAVGYLALCGWLVSVAGHAWLGGQAPAVGPVTRAVLEATLALLCWRLVWRMAMTAHRHGWREGLWALPRVVTANAIALCAMGRALVPYIRLLRGDPPRWEKTAHDFPTDPDTALR